MLTFFVLQIVLAHSGIESLKAKGCLGLLKFNILIGTVFEILSIFFVCELLLRVQESCMLRFQKLFEELVANFAGLLYFSNVLLPDTQIGVNFFGHQDVVNYGGEQAGDQLEHNISKLGPLLLLVVLLLLFAISLSCLILALFD